MKRAVIFLVSCCITMGAMAQLKVESNCDVVFPHKIKIENSSGNFGNIYLPYYTNILFGCNFSWQTSTWAIEYMGSDVLHGLSSGLNFRKPDGSYNSGDYKVFFQDNGNVGIGVGSMPLAKLHVKGSRILLQPVTSSYSMLEFNVAANHPKIKLSSTIVFYRSDDAGYANIQCGTLTQMSDSTFKTNIRKIDDDVLSKVCKLDGYTYNWKSDKDGQLQVGFIAQEVEKVFPELVETIDSSNVKLMSYIGMIPYLLEAIKAQQVQIEELKEQLNDSYGSSELKSYSIFEEEGTEVLASLSQNKPNPFSSETRIEMFVPQSVANASLYVYDLQGKQVKSITVTGRGATFETIHGSELQAGLYIYSLVTDGKLVGSKQMVLTD